MEQHQYYNDNPMQQQYYGNNAGMSAPMGGPGRGMGRGGIRQSPSGLHGGRVGLMAGGQGYETEDFENDVGNMKLMMDELTVGDSADDTKRRCVPSLAIAAAADKESTRLCACAARERETEMSRTDLCTLASAPENRGRAEEDRYPPAPRVSAMSFCRSPFSIVSRRISHERRRPWLVRQSASSAGEQAAGTSFMNPLMCRGCLGLVAISCLQ